MTDQPQKPIRQAPAPVSLALSSGSSEPLPRHERVRATRRASNQRIARLILTGILVLLGLWVLRSFLGALGWALILCIAIWPLYERFLAIVDSRRRDFLAPFIFTLLVALVFLGPLAIGGMAAGRDVNGVVAWVVEAERNGIAPPDWLSQIPLLGHQALEWWTTHLAEPGAVSELLGHTDKATLAQLTQQVGITIARRIVFLLVTLVTLFFLFRSGVAIGRRFGTLIHKLFGHSGAHMTDIIVSAVRSTADGLVLVGLGEGAFLAVAYLILGVPHPALLGALTGVLAIIPFGAPVIFSVASLLLLALGKPASAIALFIFGWVVVAIADHLVRPVLIGGAAKLPFLWVLLGIFGGLEAFGVLGLFLGPAIMAALIALWREATEPGRTTNERAFLDAR
ncbi:MAG TPA: AI-2E family transporter [Alphaproteobacteria bacterium]|nr:AI-2E family transporter [Alphaproteobacteria bacterium]